MHTRFFACVGLLVSAVAISGAAPSAPHTTTTVVHDRDKNVSAQFVSTDGTGCLLAALNISADEFSEMTAGSGHATPSRTVGLSLEYIDVCQSVPLILGEGIGEVTRLEVAPNLSGATLTASLLMADQQYGLPFTAEIALTFTAAGPRTNVHDHEVDQSTPGTTITVETHGASRPAVAIGTIAVHDHPIYGDVGNLATLASIVASIQDNRTDTTTVVRATH